MEIYVVVAAKYASADVLVMFLQGCPYAMPLRLRNLLGEFESETKVFLVPACFGRVIAGILLFECFIGKGDECAIHDGEIDELSIRNQCVQGWVHFEDLRNTTVSRAVAIDEDLGRGIVIKVKG